MSHKPFPLTTTLAGTTWTTVATAPDASKRNAVVSLLAMNLDNTTRLFSLRRKKGGATTMLRENVSVGPGLTEQMVKEGMHVLDDTDETLEMKTDATAAATEPVVDAAWMEWSA
jgi:hypothetical protein